MIKLYGKQKKIMWITVIVAVVLTAVVFQTNWNGASNAAEYWTESNDGEKQQNASAAKIDIASLNQAFVALAESMSPAVVNVFTKTKIQLPGLYGPMPEEMLPFFFGNPFSKPYGRPLEQEAQSLGSGFIINKDGYIVTNSHVVRLVGKNADEIMIKFLREDQGKGFPATVLGVDERTDVAVLKLKAPKANLTVATLGNSERAKVGEWVVAIGNPYGHAHSVTQGIVSALGRNLDNMEAEFIQTSASINPGNSGGPLFNLFGEVIGINTAIDPRAQGIGFAIPINSAKQVVHSLIKDGRVKRGWVGLMIASVTPEMVDALGLEVSNGALVREVVKNGPAERAGIKKGDIITKVGNEVITGHEKLVKVVTSFKSGERVAFEVYRKGKKEVLTVRIQEEPKGDQAKQLQS